MHLLLERSRRPLTGEIVVPPSKYHAHRALVLASLAEGTSRIDGLCDARHVRYTETLLRDLGTTVERDDSGYTVTGGPYRPRRDTVSVGSSGTTLYFMLGLAALADRPVTVEGQKYFQRRPVGPLLTALRALGVDVSCAEDRPPVLVRPGRPAGGRVRIPGTLSQWISGLVLLAPFGTGRTVVEVEGELNERPYVELTVAMMRRFGLEVGVAPDWRRFEIEPGQRATAADVTLPPDLGSAAFGVVAAAIQPADVLLRGITSLDGDAADHPESAFLRITREMGVPLALERDGLRIRHDGTSLRATTIDCREVPDMLPVLSTLACLADGDTVFENVSHVRLKESDRVAAMTQLNRMGGDLREEGADRLVVRGVRGLTGAALSSFNDHRVLMSLALAGSVADGQTRLSYPNAYRISYPDFLRDMTGIGVRIFRRDGGFRSPAGLLPDLLRRWAAERPGDTAVVDVRPDGTRCTTWQELDAGVDRAAAALLALGVRPGEPVACQLPNWTEFVEVALATLRIGAVCCPLMPIFRNREVGFMLRKAGARVLVTTDEFRGRAHATEIAAALVENGGELAGLDHVVVVGADGGVASLPVRLGHARWHDWRTVLRESTVDTKVIESRRPAPDATAQLLFTSGTTGEPKGVRHRHDTLGRAALAQAERLRLTGDDVVYIPSPLAHQTGFLYGMWLALTLGTTSLLQAVWDAETGLRALSEHGGTFVQAATPFLADLTNAVEEGVPPAPSLRIFVATGTTVPRTQAARAVSRLGVTVCGAFGTTETCLGSLSGPHDPPGKVWSTDGRAMDGTRLRVTDDSGEVLPPGQEGNFELRSKTCFEGYHGRPDLTADAYTPDGWYRTGDLAVIDSDGYVQITGRVRDVINRGGEKVPAAEIEDLLHAHPAVADVAIVGMPDERLGERACAFVVLAPDTRLDLEDVCKHLDRHAVSKYYWPERLEITAALPRNPSGKVQKFLLREQAKSLRPQPLTTPEAQSA
ncbi:3-phosphoshikimate 1-carboxyvinyltransferase [Lentzea rhizosphaerae]|uniref:3-phosphoshikimate 1-carboxyvinyltransferase n=1 Tax=Lentzea rhizosphaerae TaxID=2041025 RepID=A0ABV8BV07_9PSEU